jgi:hypothetical protein
LLYGCRVGVGRKGGGVVGTLRQATEEGEDEAWRTGHAPGYELCKVKVVMNLEVNIDLLAVIL